MTDKDAELLSCPFCGGKPFHSTKSRGGGRIRCSNGCLYKTGLPVSEWNTRAAPESSKSDVDLDDLMSIVNEQAEDWGLWFDARYISEAELQKALRRLHAAIEDLNEQTILTRTNQNLSKSTPLEQ